jgi:hypothetical protein
MKIPKKIPKKTTDDAPAVLITDAYIEAQMTKLRRELRGRGAATLSTDRFHALHHLADLQTLLDRMSVDAVSLLTKERSYHFARSQYGARRLKYFTTDDDEEEEEE